MSTAIEFNNISKQYRLGLVSTNTISHDLNRWWQTTILRKEDPYLKIGESNDRATKGTSDYVWALRDIDLKVEQGDVLGIIGKNGAGKSTLLKILSKVTAPTTGSIRARGRIASLLEVGTGFHPEMTGRENIYMNGAIMGMTKHEIKSKLDEIIDFAGVERYIDTPTKRYSSGMTVRLGFAIAAHLDPEILVVDEVLAVGDAEFQKKAIGKMQNVAKGEGRTVLFVSHNMAAVKSLCKTGVILGNGQVIKTGLIDEVVDEYININTHTEASDLLDLLQSRSNKISINEVSVNGQSGNIIELKYPHRAIDIRIRGYAYEEVRLGLEFSIYSKDDVLLAKHTPSLSTGETKHIDNKPFILEERFNLPPNITNSEYYISIDIAHPKVEYLARFPRAIKVITSYYHTSQGISIDDKHFGLLYL